MNKSVSLYLDLVRFLAAVIVVIVHANYDRFTGGLPILWRLSGLGNDAVMVFFVLSGFVIAYVSDQKEKSLEDYMVSRLARLYSVVVPALLLTVVLDWLGALVDPTLYVYPWVESDRPTWRLLINLIFANEIWFTSVRPLSNGPFWSLGYEFWYYLLFAAAVYVKGRVRTLLISLLCVLAGPKILMLFPIWLMGVAVYRRSKVALPSEWVGWLLTVGTVVAYLTFHLTDCPDRLLDFTREWFGPSIVHDHLKWSGPFLSDYVIGALVALHFYGVTAVAPRLGRVFVKLQRPIRYLAGYTFAVYLFRYPLLQFFAAVTSGMTSLSLRRGIVLGGTLVVVWAVGAVTERRKSAVRRLLQVAAQWLVRPAERR